MSVTTIDIPDDRQAGRIEFDPWIGIAFLYPISKLLVFQLVGQLYLTDILGFVLLLVMLRAPDAMHRLLQIRLLLIMLGLWFASQVVTDLLRATPAEDFLRGWAKIGFFAVQIVALWLFLPRRRSYLVAFALGSSIAWGFGIAEQFTGYEWKFGYDRALTFLILGLLCLGWRKWRGMRILSPFALAAVAVLLLYENARSSFMIALVAAMVCALVLIVERWPQIQRRINAPVFVLLLLFGVIGASTISSGYGAVVSSGALGSDAQYKYDVQTAGDIPLLLGGRSESIISVRAIADSPIIGHGSWAKDRRYIELYRSLRLRMGMDVHDNFFFTREVIPTHSYFFGAWVEAGLLGALFWLYVFTLPFFAAYRLLRSHEPLLPLVAYLAVGLVWAIPFSPFGAGERFIAAFQIVTLMWVIREARFSLRGETDTERRASRRSGVA